MLVGNGDIMNCGKRSALMRRFNKTIAATMVALMLFAGCSEKATTGKIREINVSGDGKYLIDEVVLSYGATGGESYLVMQRSDSKKVAKEGDEEPADGIKIEDTRAGYGIDYVISWNSDEQFHAYWQGRDDMFTLGRFYLTEDGVSTLGKGNIKIEEDSWFDDFTTDGVTVRFNCHIKITNELDETVPFRLSALANDDNGKLLQSAEMKCADLLKIGPNTTETFEVVFTAKKGPGDTKHDRNLPHIKLEPVYIT